ncbi:hypothetical protein HA466_0318610 [Hirschfeldia incana]|nr:hypothetical protein HA466_0318610 [Hirschfeldia incana]
MEQAEDDDDEARLVETSWWNHMSEKGSISTAVPLFLSSPAPLPSLPPFLFLLRDLLVSNIALSKLSMSSPGLFEPSYKPKTKLTKEMTIKEQNNKLL